MFFKFKNVKIFLHQFDQSTSADNLQKFDIPNFISFRVSTTRYYPGLKKRILSLHADIRDILLYMSTREEILISCHFDQESLRQTFFGSVSQDPILDHCA